MRLPSMTTPEPLASIGADLPQGRATSGRRMVENTFTTAVSAAWVMALLAAAAFGSAAMLGVVVTAARQTSRTIRRLCMRKLLSQGAAAAILTHRPFTSLPLV